MYDKKICFFNTLSLDKSSFCFVRLLFDLSKFDFIYSMQKYEEKVQTKNLK